MLNGLEVTAASLTDDRADVNNPVPMIYQSGYLTIKGYDTELRLYKLGYPNDEVKYGFLNFITPFYTSLDESKAPFYIGQFVETQFCIISFNGQIAALKNHWHRVVYVSTVVGKRGSSYFQSVQFTQIIMGLLQLRPAIQCSLWYDPPGN